MASTPGGPAGLAVVLVGLALLLPHPVSALAAQGAGGAAQRAGAPAEARPFRHGDHLPRIPCGDCHLPEERHRAQRAWTPPDCAACHHAERVVAGCTTCHERGALAGPRRHATPLALSVWPVPQIRALAFDHAFHADVGCLECHRSGMSQDIRDCGACHQSHHRVDAECAGCHAEPPTEAHDRAAHAGCAGGGCHARTDPPLPRLSRTACLACHEERRTHRPGQTCVQCHAVPFGSTHATEDPAHGLP